MKTKILSFWIIFSFSLYTLLIKSGAIFYQSENSDIASTSSLSKVLEDLYTIVNTPVEEKEVPLTSSKPVTTPPTTSNNTPSTPVKPTTPVVNPPISKKWSNGTFLGNKIDAYYGMVQVSVVIENDKMTKISFLDYPQDRSTSLKKSNKAMPILKSEAIKSQSAKVNIVSGVTYTSEAFMKSLSSALTKAKI